VTNCRTPLLALIQSETVEIDVGMWFMEDSRYSSAIIQRMQAGVQVRILMDPRANVGHPTNQQIQTQLANAGVPMRKRTASGIEHWKAMIFAGQNKLYFGSANFSADAFVPVTPYVNYVDETVYFTDNASLVSSFKTKFDDAWVNTVDYVEHANAPNASLTRHFPVTAIDPELNFPPGSGQDFANRSVGRYNAETSKIDVIMFRITDQRHTNAIIAAANRGVPVRMIVDPAEYRNEDKFWNAWNVDRLYMAIGPSRMRMTTHQGINHGKLTLLYGQSMSIFGSSNWTSPSANSQHEHNIFTTNSFVFNWYIDYFERRWNNSAPTGAIETDWFVPLPPDTPTYQSPANAATNLATTGVKLTWYAGLWAHRYDILFGTDPLNLQPLESNIELGPSQTTTQFKSYTLPTLVAGTTYYWKIVSKTMANKSSTGPIWSFRTQ
jgi:phosphatidylserine/phosphatidylglycerophosphate/cardiolipin synthase-like enzyme